MFAAVGVGAAFAGLFHLFTHASFKALLFLAAGIVIHGVAGEERLHALRGLGRFFPFSRWGFLIGALALIGTPLITAGSYSKDAIIEAALEHQPVIGWLLLGAVLLTGLYIGRLYSIVYVAATRQDAHAVHHDPETERPMNWSLVPLMVGSIAFGWLGGYLATHLEAVLGHIEPIPTLVSLSLPGLAAFALGAIGFGASWWYFVRRAEAAAAGPSMAPSYRATAWVRLIADAGYAAAGAISRVQSGLLPRYALASFLAISIVMLLRVVVLR
jgi:NADH-quinone oxidoreductase subunit L